MKALFLFFALFVSAAAFSQINSSTDTDNKVTFTFIQWTPYLWYGYIFGVQNKTATTLSFTISTPNGAIAGTVEPYAYQTFRTDDGFINYREHANLTLQYSSATMQGRLKVKTTGSPYQ